MMTDTTIHEDGKTCDEIVGNHEAISDDELSVIHSNDGRATNINKQRQSAALREQQLFTQEASTSVRRLKVGMIVVLCLSAIAAGGLSFWYLRRTELLKFRIMFEDDASKLGHAFYGNIVNILGGMDLLARIMVSHAAFANETFPFTTVPDFSIIGSKILSMSPSLSISNTMLVDGIDQRLQWEEYAWSKRSTVNETLNIMQSDPTYFGDIPWNVPMERSLHDAFGPLPYNESRLYAPVWQGYPLFSEDFAAFNWDWLTDEDTDSLIQCINTSQAIIGEPFILPDPNNAQEVSDAEYWASAYENTVDPGESTMEPVSDILYPVINIKDRVQTITDQNSTSADKEQEEETKQVVAVVSVTFYWRDTLKNVLPSNKRGLVVVIENPCTASFTYRIDGQDATFLGRGPLHDPDYQHMEIHRNFFELSHGNTMQFQYTGVPVSKEYCTFSVKMYPSVAMKKQFISYNPLLFATVAMLIFVFTSMVFLVYDTKVEIRQQLVTTRAVGTTAILSSLFPNTVREKLLLQQNDSNHGTAAFDVIPTTNQNTVLSENVNGINDSMSPVPADDSDDNYTGSSAYSNLIMKKFASPIADLYLNTTVFFADIRGFTAWSSSRSPNDVFILLEALYSEFDMIAQRRKVFKVETIGDSYVAAAGLPEPMRQHATVMVKFAEDVVKKMKHVVTELSTCFGPDTADLTLRVGLNSGPTTAGVIRGEKSRFQLFGDTVNTAARMESTGIPGKIQCTPKTAELLQMDGKGHWLTQRTDIVSVKGKGDMTTFWVKIQPRSVISMDETCTINNENNDEIVLPNGLHSN